MNPRPLGPQLHQTAPRLVAAAVSLGCVNPSKPALADAAFVKTAVLSEATPDVIVDPKRQEELDTLRTLTGATAKESHRDLRWAELPDIGLERRSSTKALGPNRFDSSMGCSRRGYDAQASRQRVRLRHMCGHVRRQWRQLSRRDGP